MLERPTPNEAATFSAASLLLALQRTTRLTGALAQQARDVARRPPSYKKRRVKSAEPRETDVRRQESRRSTEHEGEGEPQ